MQKNMWFHYFVDALLAKVSAEQIVHDQNVFSA